MIKVDVNSDGLVWYSNQLEKMHQSAFPNAVRGTLNGLAFDVKKTTMPKEASKFTNRNKTFFKANSRVDKAKGFDVNRMESTVGFIAKSGTKNNKAVEELEQQEFGGVIKDRELIPLKIARIGKSGDRKVNSKNRLSALPKVTDKSVFDAKKNKSKSKKQRYIRTIIAAKKSKNSTTYILGNPYTKKGIRQQTLSRIDVFGSNLKTRKLIVERTPLYSYSKNRLVKIKPTNFMKRASYESGLNINEIFRKEAQRQYERYYNS